MELSVEDIKLVIAKLLRDRRIEMGMTQLDLANAMGVQQSHVARMEAIGPGTIELLMRAVTSLGMRLILEPSKTAKVVDKALTASGQVTVDKAIDALFDAPPDTPFEVKPGNVRVKPYAGDLVPKCKIHGTPLDGRGRCLMKGCKYG